MKPEEMLLFKKELRLLKIEKKNQKLYKCYGSFIDNHIQLIEQVINYKEKRKP